MHANAIRQLLCEESGASFYRYAVVDAAETHDSDEIVSGLMRADSGAVILFSGENAVAARHAAPYLLCLDKHPEVETWLIEKGWGHGWGILLTAEADSHALWSHLRRFFRVQAPNGRDLYFRFYDPVVLRDFLPLLDDVEARGFFGPVRRFVVEAPGGRPVVFDRPPGEAIAEADPAAILFGQKKKKAFSRGWNNLLFDEHLRKYQRLGMTAAAELDTLSLALRDAGGGTARLQKTEKGVAVTTGEGRVFDYALSLCKHPVGITDPDGGVIHFDIQERQNRPDPPPDQFPEDIPPSETLLHAIRRDADQKSWVFEYDDKNHLQRIDYPDGSHAAMVHDTYGNLIAFSDRNSCTTRYELDFNERLICLTDANEHRTRFEYDDMTAPSAIHFADGGRFNFSYTPEGVLECFAAGNTVVADYQVDPESGSWAVNYADGTRVDFQVQNGRITRAANSDGVVELTYDAAGRLISETFQGRTVTFHRDAVGHLTGITTPFGETIHYMRDSEHRVRAIRDWDGRTIDIRYALSGVLESIAYPNGTALNQCSGADGLADELRLSVAGAVEPIFQRHFSRDPLGRVTCIHRGDTEIVYTYDREGRLIAARSNDPDLDERFSLDAKANRTADTHTRYHLNAADRIVEAAGRDFEYDALGNLTRGHADYGYTTLNRLTSIGHAGERVRYGYDAFGRRVFKEVNGTRTQFIWAGSQLLHEITWDAEERNPSGIVTDYLFFPETDALLAIRRQSCTNWAVFGHRYEVVCLTGADGEPVWQAEYDAFGKATIQTGAVLFQPFRLAGQYRDAESGLHYNKARYYDPSMGRYLSMDPLFLEGGSDNFYVYCNGDPINHVDPCGEFIFVPILIGAALGAAIGGAIEAVRRRRAGQGRDGFKIAKAALLGGAIGAVGGGVGAAVEAAVAAGTAGTAMASGTLAGMGATGFLSGTAGSVAEQCAQASATDIGINPLALIRQALTDGVLGARMGMDTFGSGGFLAKRLRKAAAAFRPDLPVERSVALLARVTEKSRQLSAKARSLGARKTGRANDFCVSDPVNPITGEVVLAQTDFSLPGRIPLTWTRHYGSRSGYSGLLGANWQTPADARLEIDADGIVTFYDGTPKAAVFASLPNEEPVMEAVDGAVLEATPQAYRVRLKSGYTYHFGRDFNGSRSHVFQISDTSGHWLRFDRRDNELFRIRDDNGRNICVVSRDGRIVQMRHHDTLLVRYMYLGDELNIAMDSLGHCKRFEYQDGHLVRHMDKNAFSFRYTYDDSGRCIHVRGDNGLHEYHLEYPPYERATRVTDSRGHVQTYYYNPDNLPLRIQDHAGAVTGYTYDDVGRVISITDPLNNTTHYDYDNAGNLVQILKPNNDRIAFVYDTNHRPVQFLDPNGKLWEQCFDSRGRLIEKIDPLDNRIRYHYDSQGDLAAVTDARGYTAHFEYDACGLLSAVTDPNNATTRFQRDLLGNITAGIDPAGRITRYIHDAKSRLCEVVRPFADIRRSFAWDPEDNLVLYTDANGFQTRFEYGGVNEIVSRLNPDGSRVTYHYDTEENLTGVIDENGQTHRFEYDPAGRLRAKTDPYGHTTRYTYDPAGRMVERIDPLERIITYTYDPAGRLQSKTFANEEQEFFNWDANGNLVGFQSPDALVECFFDAAGRLAAEKSGAFVVAYQYDGNGRCTRRTTSHGNIVQYGYDAVGAVLSVQINDHAPVTIERDTLGRISSEHVSPYLQRAFAYTEEGYIERQSISGAAGPIERRYAYDPDGNRVAGHDSRTGAWRFDYDPMGRITEALDPEQRLHRLAYDRAGDLLEHLPDTGLGLRSARYNAALYSYDAAGNLAERREGDELTRFAWDAQNRLKSVRIADATEIIMACDALGRRCRKTVNGERTFFTWDGDVLLSERFEDQPAREYVYYPDTFEPLAAIDGDGQVYYYHNDPNGLPLELTRPNGEIVWSASYDHMGRVAQIAVNDVAQPLRMQGQYSDPELDLCYNRHRYFDPRICAFISQDPLGLAAGTNLYAYAPNVWGWVDPLGLSCKQDGSKTTSIKKFYPDDEGFLGILEHKFLKPGEKIDRFGGSDYSRFFSPQGTPKQARALPPGTADQTLRTFQVAKPFEVKSGTVAPAFGELGLGTQYKTPVRMGTLLKRGIISELE
jgi:RHS repeat-associated protein